MQKIKVKYADEKGTTREEIFETTSVADMRQAFSDKGYYIIYEELLRQPLFERVNEFFFPSRRASVKELNEFTKLVKTLLRSGMPITEAISILLEDAEDTALNRALERVSADIKEGVSLSAALSRHPDIFPQIYVKTIVAGEKAGALENILGRLSDYFTRSIAIRRKIVAALIYPSILLLVSVAAVSYMMVAVVPEFVGLFNSLGVELPWYTQVLLAVSGFIGDWFWYLIFVAALSVSTVVVYSRNPQGRKIIDAYKLKIPLIRDLERDFAFSQYARTLSTMVAGGIPLLDGLGVVLDTLENRVIADRYEIIPDLLEGGMGFGQALKQVPETPKMMTRIISVGEEAGNLGEMLENLADYFDEEIAELTDRATALLEPILFLGMAVVAGALIIAILLPVLSAASNIN